MNEKDLELLGCGFDGGDIRGGWRKTRWDALVHGRRLFKGGSSNQAIQIENDRIARRDAAIAAINKAFDDANRGELYDDQFKTVYDLNSKEVNRQYDLAERANRFGMARNGLLGGSVDIDSNSELNRRTNEGIAQATSLADASRADLMAADEQSRNNLISMATGGTDATTAAQQAAQGMASNIAAAQADKDVATIGNLFNDIQNAYIYSSLGKYAQLLNNSALPYSSSGNSADKTSVKNSYQGSES